MLRCLAHATGLGLGFALAANAWSSDALNGTGEDRNEIPSETVGDQPGSDAGSARPDSGGSGRGTPTHATIVGIATWKHGAKAAYTMIHDDAGGTTSITDLAVPEMRKRGILAGLGVIGSAIEKNPTQQKALRAAAAAGFEILNHSYSHVPKVTNFCQGVRVNPCGGGQGSNKEIIGNQTLLESLLSTKVTYYIYPYDYRDPDVAALVAQSHLGDRSGYFLGGVRTGVNSVDFDDYDNAFETAGQEYIPSDQLNSYVDSTISKGGWASRELHGVGDDTWGHLTESAYKKHLDYIKGKVDAGDLWIAPPSTVIKYKHLRSDCGLPTSTGSTISFPHRSADCSKYATEVSVIVTAPVSTLHVVQGTTRLAVASKSGQFLIDVDPTGGDLTVSGE